jgi:hypothetical protein
MFDQWLADEKRKLILASYVNERATIASWGNWRAGVPDNNGKRKMG